MNKKVPTSRIEVIVVTRNSAPHIGPCIDSIVAARALPIVVDNVSTDDTLNIVRNRCPEAVIVAAPGNLGYGKALNLGFKETKGEFVVLSNPDVVFLENSIEAMVGFLRENPKVALTGPQQMFPDRRWQRSFGDLPGIWPGIKDAVGITTLHNRLRQRLWPIKLDRRPKDVPYVDGAVLAVRRKAFEQADGFDKDIFFYADESDLCIRLRKLGWRTVFYPHAYVTHIRGGDSIKVDRSEKFLQHMIDSQSRLAVNSLSPWKARFYMRCQRVQFLRLTLANRLCGLFAQGPTAERFSYKTWFCGTYAKLWKERIRQDHLALR